jgi:hypothetical protein
MKQKELHIPARIQIMGQTFEIQLSEHIMNHKGQKVSGIVWHNGPNLIQVRCYNGLRTGPKVCRQQRERIYLHEVLHSVLRITGQESAIKSGRQEELVDSLAYGLQQALTMQSEEPAQEVAHESEIPEGMSSMPGLNELLKGDAG